MLCRRIVVFGGWLMLLIATGAVSGHLVSRGLNLAAEMAVNPVSQEEARQRLVVGE